MSVLGTARRLLGKPYKWAAEGSAAFDCSALLHWAMRDPRAEQ